MRRIAATSLRVLEQQGLAALATQILEKVNRREFRIIPPSVADSEYQAWIVQNEPDEAELVKQKAEAKKLDYRPLISLIAPVWNPPVQVLRDMIESVLSQTYDNWQLCIADGSTDVDVRGTLQGFTTDSRIKVTFLPKNLGVSGNSNMAIQASEGEFVAFLDQDDVLAPFALFEVAKSLNGTPGLDFIYSDMDRLDADGRRFDPLFKPDWSPEIMLCANYIVHLCVIRASLLRRLGGFRPETDRAQDWDLILRTEEATDRTHHIPRILYHWRQSPISVATAGFRIKPASPKAQRLAISDYLKRNRVSANIELDGAGCWRMLWNYSPPPRVSIVLFSHGDQTALQDSAKSVQSKTSYPDFEVTAVQAGNGAPNLGDGHLRLIRCGKVSSFAEAYNLGAKQSKGDVLVFLDAHVEVLSADWLQELVGWAIQPRIGAVGPKLMSSDLKHIVHCGIVLGLPNFLFSGATERTWSPLGLSEWYRDCSAVSGACLATRRDVFDAIGGFDEKLAAAADMVYCSEARKRGYRVMFTPMARLVLYDPLDHVPDQRSIEILPWCNELGETGDPYFNPNLSYQHPVPRLKDLSNQPAEDG